MHHFESLWFLCSARSIKACLTSAKFVRVEAVKNASACRGHEHYSQQTWKCRKGLAAQGRHLQAGRSPGQLVATKAAEQYSLSRGNFSYLTLTYFVVYMWSGSRLFPSLIYLAASVDVKCQRLGELLGLTVCFLMRYCNTTLPNKKKSDTAQTKKFHKISYRTMCYEKRESTEFCN